MGRGGCWTGGTPWPALGSYGAGVTLSVVPGWVDGWAFMYLYAPGSIDRWPPGKGLPLAEVDPASSQHMSSLRGSGQPHRSFRGKLMKASEI